MINEKEFNINEIAREVENYLSHVVPTGDWKHAKDDTPIMSRLVQTYFTTKASKPTKLDYHNDVIDAISDNNKLSGMATEQLRMMDGSLVNVIKILAGDTVNINGQTTTALIANELRREFIQSQYRLSETPVNPGDKVTELNMDGADATVIVKMLASLEAVEALNAMMRNMNDNIVNAIPFIGALIMNSGNPDLWTAFRQMCAVLEMFGVMKPILTSLHSASKNLVGSGRSINTSGVTVGGSENANTEPKMSDLMNRVNVISESFKPYGNNVAGNIMNMLGTATPSDIQDIESIIKGVSLPIINHERYLGAISTAFSFQQVPDIIKQAPKNYTVALLYISKMYAESVNNRPITSGEVSQMTSEVLGQQVVSIPNYRATIANTIAYDMDAKNGNATMALARVLGIHDLYTFASSFLNNNGSQPWLTKEAVMAYARGGSLQTSNVTISDVDGFLQSKGYNIANSVPHYKNELLNAIMTAVNTR